MCWGGRGGVVFRGYVGRRREGGDAMEVKCCVRLKGWGLGGAVGRSRMGWG